MKRLELIGLECIKTTKAEAVDEPYLTADANVHSVGIRSLGTIWGPHSMDDGDARNAYWHCDFDDWIIIKLYEYDRIGRDEHIDTLTIHEDDPVGAVRNPYSFTGHGAIYRLFYRLIPEEEIGSHAEDATLILRSLYCKDALESEDEPYIVVNGVSRWGPGKMKTRDRVSLEDRLVPFSGTADIELWEHDPLVSNMIDSYIVHFDVVGVGEESEDLPAEFEMGSGVVDAKYTLTYRVRRERH